MNNIFLRWGLPALITVVAGTAFTISMTGANIASDLSDRTGRALDSGYGWAQVAFDGRDALVTGTAADQQVVEDVLARVAAVHGVRSVTSGMVLAEHVSPFPFAASIADGEVALSGGVPDETAHAELVLRSGAATDELRLLAGAPPRAAWQAAVDHGLAYLEHFDRGEVRLADLTLTITGRAGSPADFDALTALQRAGAPDGVAFGAVEIAPPLMAPYDWRAHFDGRSVAISGYAPDEEFVQRIRAADLQGLPVATSLVLASGAPENFDSTALMLLHNLVQLEAGTASISDATARLVGAPGDREAAELVRRSVAQAGATVTLDPPRVAQYYFTATRRDGTIVLDGLVPDAATLEQFQGMASVDASGLELARGAPSRFASAVDFGLDILDHLSEGRFSIRDTVLALHGRAKTLADFAAAETIVALGAPQGLILAKAELRPPLATPFTWAAEKGADGRLRLSGYVPSQIVRGALLTAAGTAVDTSTLADGAPAGFASLAETSLGLLPLLERGRISYDGHGWSVTGTVDSAEQALLAEAAFAEAGLRDAGWTYDVSLPPPPVPVIDPYRWQAQKAPDGTISFDGYVPTPEFRGFVAVRAGNRLVDSTELGAGAPQGFISAALAGLDALLALHEGTLAFDGATWTLSGATGTDPQRTAIRQALAAATDIAAWQVKIEAPDAVPTVAPYLWRAAKTADGNVSLSGYVSTEELKRFVAVRAGNVVRDLTEVAAGAPEGFIADVLAGLEALNALASGTVRYDGSKWMLAGVPKSAADAEAARAALATASDGGAGWDTTIAEPAAIAAPEDVAVAVVDAVVEPEPAVVSVPQPEPLAGPAVFEASKAPAAPIVLEGRVPADATRRYFAVIAGNVPADGLTVGADLPADFIPNADAGIRALAALSDGRLGFDGSTWMLEGRAETEEARLAALAGLAASPSAGAWRADLNLVPPLELCSARVTSFATRNAILFQSGSATITESSLPALDELAGYLALCPEAAVHVEGHTDADGEEMPNLALSVARAEAVVAALIARGVGPERLYAIGYGEGLPLADNDTSAGKQANRRIAFTIVDGHQ